MQLLFLTPGVRGRCGSGGCQCPRQVWARLGPFWEALGRSEDSPVEEDATVPLSFTSILTFCRAWDTWRGSWSEIEVDPGRC